MFSLLVVPKNLLNKNRLQYLYSHRDLSKNITNLLGIYFEAIEKTEGFINMKRRSKLIDIQRNSSYFENEILVELQCIFICTVVLFTEWTLTAQMVNQTVRESYGTKSSYHF